MQNFETKIPAPIIAITAGGIMKLYAGTAHISIDASPVLAEVGILLSQFSAVIALLAFASFMSREDHDQPARPVPRIVTGYGRHLSGHTQSDVPEPAGCFSSHTRCVLARGLSG